MTQFGGVFVVPVGGAQVSFGPISWLMVSEIFALRVRGRAQSVATLLNFGSNAVVTFALPPIQVLTPLPLLSPGLVMSHGRAHPRLNHGVFRMHISSCYE